MLFGFCTSIPFSDRGYGEGCGWAGVSAQPCASWRAGQACSPLPWRTRLYSAGVWFFACSVFPLHGGLAVLGFLQAFLTVPFHHRCRCRALGVGRGPGCCCPAIGRGMRRVRPFPPPSLACFIFLHALGRVEPSPVWFVVFFFLIIYL